MKIADGVSLEWRGQNSVTVNGFRFSKLQATLGLMLMAVLNVSGQEAAAPPPNGHQPTVP
jgi:hypothetical protein